MSSAPSLAEFDRFLILVSASGLLKPADLQEAVEHFRQETQASSTDQCNVTAFCNVLVATGKLTTWQCGKLRDGRYKGFFLDNYKLLDNVGVKGMHSEFLAEDVATKRRVVLCITPPTIAPLKDGKPEYRVEDWQEPKSEG
jgi:eukaryotic-like serine/threonine-protein kinase